MERGRGGGDCVSEMGNVEGEDEVKKTKEGREWIRRGEEDEQMKGGRRRGDR